MIILAIETSCDETAAAIIKNGTEVLSNVVASQADIHAVTGGVVPEVAAREHCLQLPFIYKQALEEANLTMADISAIASTTEPGLVGALLVGSTTAQTLAKIYDKPYLPTNHIHGHLYSTFLERTEDQIKFPFLSLTVSGGHTQLVLVTEPGKHQLLGHTQDDAAGEAYDKIAKMIGLPYPGGPHIATLAQKGNENAYDLPIAKLDQEYNFSFSGLKTAVLYLIRGLCEGSADELTAKQQADIAASAQLAINRALSKGIMRAVKNYDCKQVHLVGGVSANKHLRELLIKRLSTHDVDLLTPTKIKYCTDNAAMIGAAAYWEHIQPNF